MHMQTYFLVFLREQETNRESLLKTFFSVRFSIGFMQFLSLKNYEYNENNDY